MSERRVRRVAKGKRPQYFHDPATDKLMAIVVSLLGELSVTRDRLDALERLLESEGRLSRGRLDALAFDDAALAERDRQRQDYIRRVMRIVTMELQPTNDDGATPSFDEQMKSLMR
ncbi:MAG: hypothetical protein AAFX56_14125 [Pseudomonadota bacterium]